MLHLPGLMMPGQFGPEQPGAGELARRAGCRPAASSWAGMPSVMHTMNGDAGRGGLDDGVGGELRRAPTMNEALAPVASTASATVAKTGMPSTSSPPLFGLVPATTLVP